MGSESPSSTPSCRLACFVPSSKPTSPLHPSSFVAPWPPSSACLATTSRTRVLASLLKNLSQDPAAGGPRRSSLTADLYGVGAPARYAARYGPVDLRRRHSPTSAGGGVGDRRPISGILHGLGRRPGCPSCRGA